MQAKGWTLGGETSGHILCLDKHTTGDGIVSALQVLRAICESGETLDAMTADVENYAQVMINVPVKKGFKLDHSEAVKTAVAQAQTSLNGSGRIVLRASGTEPVVRVMVETRTVEEAQRWAESIAGRVRTAAL